MYQAKNVKKDVNVVIIPPMVNFQIEESQITYENLDYSNRKPYHQYDDGKLIHISNLN